MTRWYVLQVLTGRELSVRDALAQAGVQAKVPRELAYIRRGGTWVLTEKTIIPGYVFMGLREELTDAVYYLSTGIPGVVRLLGVPRPLAISKLEAERLYLLTPSDEPLRPSAVRFVDGRAVVLDGPLKPLRGRLVKVDRHRRRAYVRMPVQGEHKVVELAIRPVEASDEHPRK